jgi:hypothetical protein
LGVRDSVEKVPRIEGVVPKELKRFAMVLVSSGARGKVHDRAGIPAVLGWESRVINLGFRESVNRRLERDLVLNIVVQVDSVDQPVGRVFTLSRGINSE